MDSVDFRKTKITDKIRVSSAAIFMSANFGKYTQYETWIFSDDERQLSHQVIHGTNSGYEIHAFYKEKAIKVHQYISDNLLKKFDVTK